MTRFFLLSILIFHLHGIRAQTTVSGKITGNRNQPVAGASITLKDTYDGATSDSLGRYSFTTDEKGSFILVISAVGFREMEKQVALGLEEAVVLDIALKEKIDEMTVVVITAGSFEAGDKKRVTVLSSIDVATTAGANADVTGALKTLPGAQQVGESEGLFVRGGTAGETKTFIDGTLVNNFFHSSVPGIAQRGRFSPFLFKGTVFSTGGYSALYGQALSSALILESIDLPEQSSGNIGLSVLSGDFGYQHLAKNKKSSWGFSYGYANLWLAFKAIPQRQEYERVPSYHTADANFRIKTSGSGIVKYYGYFSSNSLGMRMSSLDTLGFKDAFRLKNFNMFHNLSWRENLGRGWKLNAGVSYTHNTDDIQGALLNAQNKEASVQGLEFRNFSLRAPGDYWNAKLVLDKRLAGLSVLRFGAEHNRFRDISDYTDHFGHTYRTRIHEDITAAFAEADIYITNRLALKTGARYEYATLPARSNLAPRVSLAYKTGAQSQVSLAYGSFYQNPERRYLPATGNTGFAKATHYIAQYQKVTKDITFRTEIFYKKYDHLFKTAMNSYGQQSVISNGGFGDAKGIEIFWRDKKTFKNLDYWLSYSYLDTQRDFLNFPYAVQPNFAAKHTASLVLKRFVTEWKTGFNASYTYASGRPYYHIGFSNGEPVFTDRGKTKDYHNVSFSLNYIPDLFKKESRRFTVLVLSVNNIFGINQVFGYNYSVSGLRKAAIHPPSRTFVFIGAFISLGTDRTQEAINSNL